MSRIIFFVLIIAVIYFAWRSMRLKQIQLEKRLDKQEKANLAEHKNDMPGEKMVSCANCGLYVPISEAIYSNGKYYCSRQHAMKGPKAHCWRATTIPIPSRYATKSLKSAKPPLQSGTI